MLARILCLGSACLMLAAPTAAGDLFTFSRTANASANDSIGPAPPAEQAVNNVDRAGPVLVAVSDRTPDLLNTAGAFAESSFGHLRVRSESTSRDGLQKSSSADAAFQDELSMAGAGAPGVSYRFAGSFRVEGSTTYLATTGLSVINVAYSWNAYQDGGATHLGGDLRQFERNSSGVGFVGTDFLGSVIPVEFDFVWGRPVILEMTLGAGAAANSVTSGPGCYAAASVLMGDSLTWLGASITTLDGNPLDDATMLGSSGTDWATSAVVPEPALIALVFLGLAARLRRKGRLPRGAPRA